MIEQNRNKYKGKCYICGNAVEVGEGYFEYQKNKHSWVTKHATGTIEELTRCPKSIAFIRHNEGLS